MDEPKRWEKGLAVMNRSRQKGGAVVVKPRGRPAGTGRRTMMHEALARALMGFVKA